MAFVKNPVDQGPFKPRCEREREEALEQRYRRLAIPEVVAAARQMASAPWAARRNDDQDKR